MQCILDKRPIGCGNSLVQTNVDGETKVIAIDSSGIIWAGAASTVHKIASGGNELLTISPGTTVNDIVIDSAGLVWAAAGNNAKRYTTGGSYQTTITPGGAINALAADPAGSVIWIGAGTTAYKYNFSGNQLASFSASGTISSIIVHSGGTIWVGAGSTVHKLSSGGTEIADFSVGATIIDIIEDGGGSIWVATANNVKKYALAADGSVLETITPPGGNIKDIDLDSSGSIWVAAGNQAIQYSTGGVEICSVDEGKPVTALSTSTVVWIGVCFLGSLITSDKTTCAFGQVNVGSSANCTFSVTNTGDLPLSNITVTSPSDPAFSIINPLPSTINPGVTEVLEVRFTPSADQNYSDQITINSNASNGPLPLYLNGNGYIPKPIIASDKTTCVFGQVNIGNSANCSFQITNSGELPLTTITVTPPTNPVFAIINSLPSMINPGVTEVLTVKFTPSAEQNYSDQITINSNASNGPLPLYLNGNGYIPKPIIASDKTTCVFGQVNIGNSANCSFQITNSGELPLTTITVTPPTNPVFAIINSLPSMINPGVTEVLTVKFTPSAEQNYSDQITINSNASNGPLPLYLNGNGYIPKPDISSQNNQYLGEADWYLNEEKVVNVEFSNIGDATLNLNSIDIISDTPNIFTLEGLPDQSPLAPSAIRTVQIHFKPTDEQLFSGHLVVDSDDPDENPHSVNFTANGHHPVPIMRLTTTILDFPDVELGFAFVKSLEIYNDGDADLEVTVTKDDPLDPDHVNFILNEGSYTIAVASAPVSILKTFQPQDIGWFSVTLRLSGTDPVTPEWGDIQYVVLNGRGITPIPIDGVLVFDRSGSMREPAGLDTKINTLRQAADLFIHRLALRSSLNKISYVRYNHAYDTYLDLNNIEGDHLIEAENKLSESATDIGGPLYPTGTTCIGGGLQTGADILFASPADRKHIMVVITDGKENKSPYIDQVKDPIINRDQVLQIYSVGVGDSINADKLQEISNRTNGYHQIIQELTGEQIFELEAFYFKVFSHASGEELAEDPTKFLSLEHPTMVSRAKIISSDRSATFLVLDNPDFRHLYDLRLIAPNGQIIQNGSSIGGMSIKVMQRYTYALYRVLFPPDPTAYIGNWELWLFPKHDREKSALGKQSLVIKSLYTRYNFALPQNAQKYMVPVGFIAAVKSNYRMNVSLIAGSYLPGSPVKLQAALTDSGWPTTDAKVEVDITTPSGIQHNSYPLFDDGTHEDAVKNDGIWTNTFPFTDEIGTYKLLFRSIGKNHNGELAKREASRFLTLTYPSREVPERLCIPCWLKRLLWLLAILFLLSNFFLLLLLTLS
ncbi:MAG: choice-of-anchor D domain-containing protein [Candidatus Heimdallarchaeota archaeon]